jgi:hypothetical protein
MEAMPVYDDLNLLETLTVMDLHVHSIIIIYKKEIYLTDHASYNHLWVFWGS